MNLWIDNTINNSYLNDSGWRKLKTPNSQNWRSSTPKLSKFREKTIVFSNLLKWLKGLMDPSWTSWRFQRCMSRIAGNIYVWELILWATVIEALILPYCRVSFLIFIFFSWWIQLASCHNQSFVINYF